MQINARDWTFEVTPDPTVATPVWSEIGGVESFTLSNSASEATVDTTTFASAGNAESQAMQRGASLSVSGKVERSAAGVPDAGQDAADKLAALVGEASLGGVRFRHATDQEWTVWDAWATKGDNTGGTNDKTAWSATFTRSGAATTAAVV